MAPSRPFQRVLLFLCAWAYTAVAGSGLCWGRHARGLYAGFLGPVNPVHSCALPPSLAASTRVPSEDPASVSPEVAATAAGAPQEASTVTPLLTFVDWGRCRNLPGNSEELLHQQQLQEQRMGRGSSQVHGLIYCTSWDPRSKALVSAIRLLQQDALGRTEGTRIFEDEQPRLPQYPIIGVRVTNSLVIARGRRALAKQRRMACNMKQLRHNERVLRFMLQQQPPLQLRGLPALQLYALQQHHQQHQGPEQQRSEAPAGWASSVQQLLEIRSLGPRTLKQLGEDDGALLSAWGPHGPPQGPPEAGRLGAWLRRLGQLYEDELKQLVEKRLQQADEEYPIYTSYSP